MARAPIRIRAHVREAIAPFARARATIGSFVRGLDWPLVILIVGFVVVAPIFGGSSGGFNGAIRWLTRLVITTPMEAYEQSIAAAETSLNEASFVLYGLSAEERAMVLAG